MTAVIIIRKTDEENWAEIIDCEDKEEAKEVLESRYYKELYNQRIVYDCTINENLEYGNIETVDKKIIFYLIKKENSCFC